MTEHNYNSVFCNQKQDSTKNVNANLSDNLNGATYFFPRSLRPLGIYDNKKCILQSGASTNPYITYYSCAN